MTHIPHTNRKLRALCCSLLPLAIIQSSEQLKVTGCLERLTQPVKTVTSQSDVLATLRSCTECQSAGVLVTFHVLKSRNATAQPA
jgi:hypothetical protein